MISNKRWFFRVKYVHGPVTLSLFTTQSGKQSSFLFRLTSPSNPLLHRYFQCTCSTLHVRLAGLPVGVVKAGAVYPLPKSIMVDIHSFDPEVLFWGHFSDDGVLLQGVNGGQMSAQSLEGSFCCGWRGWRGSVKYLKHFTAQPDWQKVVQPSGPPPANIVKWVDKQTILVISFDWWFLSTTTIF